jgi:hypothetical protein
MKLLWWNISKKKGESIEIVSLREQQMIEKGLKYVTDGSAGFKIGGKSQKLAYAYSESIYNINGVERTTQSYTYYYWDKFFRNWMMAFGSTQHSDKEIQTEKESNE